jgi:kynurenine formamidase
MLDARVCAGKQQLLGIGDDTGTLHILEVPWSLRQAVPNEVAHRKLLTNQIASLINLTLLISKEMLQLCEKCSIYCSCKV